MLCIHIESKSKTRITRTPAFWEYHHPPPPATSQVKTRQSQSYKFKEFAKTSNFEILKSTLHAIHLLKLFDKMCKVKWIRLVLLKIQSGHDSVHRRTDGWTDGQGETSIPPFNFVEVEGIIKHLGMSAHDIFTDQIYHCTHTNLPGYASSGNLSLFAKVMWRRSQRLLII